MAIAVEIAHMEERYAHICVQVDVDGASARVRQRSRYQQSAETAWVITGAIAPGGTPPYNLSREAIEKAITASGFQLWRLRETAEAQT
jgi:hypothetical protein